MKNGGLDNDLNNFCVLLSDDEVAHALTTGTTDQEFIAYLGRMVIFRLEMEMNALERETGCAYKGWTITYNPKPIPDRLNDYDATHDEYCGPPDDRCFTAKSFADARSQIEEYVSEN